jgi:hypothetical protein
MSEKTKKEKSNVIPLKEELSEDDMKQLVNHKYRESNMQNKIVQEAIDGLTNKYKKQLDDVIGFVHERLQLKEHVDPVTGKKSYEMDFNLSDSELEYLAIKIPALCMYIQEFVNDRALDATLAEHFADEAVTENLKIIINKQYKGDAKERLRFAEQGAELEKLVSIIKKQVYQNLKSYIERADKIYEGIKKVLDGRNEERKLAKKHGKFNP